MDEKNEISSGGDKNIQPSLGNPVKGSVKELTIIQRILNRKKIILGSVVLIVLIPLAFYIMNSIRLNEVYKYKNDADKFLMNGNYQNADGVIEAGLSKFKDDKGLLIRKITVSTIKGNLSGTEKEQFNENKTTIERLIKDSPNDADVLLVTGYAYEAAGDYDKALELYEIAIKNSPKNALAYFRKGHVLSFLNRINESEDALNLAYELNPNLPIILLERANRSRMNGKGLDSIELYNKVVNSAQSSNDDKAEALTGLAIINSARGDNASALKFAQQSFEANKLYSPGVGMYGFLLSLNGQVGSGIKYIFESIKQNPRITFNYLAAGISFRMIGQTEPTLLYLKKGIEIVDDDNTVIGTQRKSILRAKLLYEIAQTYSLAKNRNDAVSYLKNALREDPTLVYTLKKSIDNGYFQYIKSDPEILRYIK